MELFSAHSTDTHSDMMYIPLGVLLPLVKTSQSPVPEGLSSSHTGRWERRWTTLVNPREETGRSSSKYSCMRGGGEGERRLEKMCVVKKKGRGRGYTTLHIHKC